MSSSNLYGEMKKIPTNKNKSLYIFYRLLMQRSSRDVVGCTVVTTRRGSNESLVWRRLPSSILRGYNRTGYLLQIM